MYLSHGKCSTLAKCVFEHFTVRWIWFKEQYMEKTYAWYVLSFSLYQFFFWKLYQNIIDNKHYFEEKTIYTFVVLIQKQLGHSESIIMKHGDGISLTTSPVPDAFPGRGRCGDGVWTFQKRFRKVGTAKFFGDGEFRFWKRF